MIAVIAGAASHLPAELVTEVALIRKARLQGNLCERFSRKNQLATRLSNPKLADVLLRAEVEGIPKPPLERPH